MDVSLALKQSHGGVFNALRGSDRRETDQKALLALSSERGMKGRSSVGLRQEEGYIQYSNKDKTILCG